MDTLVVTDKILYHKKDIKYNNAKPCKNPTRLCTETKAPELKQQQSHGHAMQEPQIIALQNVLTFTFDNYSRIEHVELTSLLYNQQLF